MDKSVLRIPSTIHQQGIKKILELASATIDVVGIDELQFFPKEIVPVILTLVEQGKHVIVSGLDLDFRGEPFGVMPTLMALADQTTKLTAVCASCGKNMPTTHKELLTVSRQNMTILLL